MVYRKTRRESEKRKTVIRQASYPGDHRDIEPPDPISNSEVKSVIADDSVGIPHVKVGHHQVETRKPDTRDLYRAFFMEKRE